jgi:hypothetical protein
VRGPTGVLSHAARRGAADVARGCTQDLDLGYNVADGGRGIGSDGVKAVHKRPGYRAEFMAQRFARAAAAATTRARRKAEGYYG